MPVKKNSNIRKYIHVLNDLLITKTRINFWAPGRAFHCKFRHEMS